jgi:hypothetical protein
MRWDRIPLEVTRTPWTARRLRFLKRLTDDRSSDQFVVLGDILRVLVARKIIIEDRFLCEHFGEVYRRFKQTTKALVPFVI